MLPKIDHQQTSEKIVHFLKSTFEKTRFTKAVVAVSGGVDSAVSLTLTVKALGREHVYPLFLPYGQLNAQGVTDSRLLVTQLAIPESNIQEINIQPLVDPFIARDEAMDNIRKGNIMARSRMIVVYDEAKRRNALVVGTENKTEHFLGYYTRFGDEASDIEPIRTLYKTQVYELARFLDIPEPILTKSPTAGLWPGQTDEGEFGFTYKEADQVLFHHIEVKEPKEQIIAMGFQKEVVESILGYFERNRFKTGLPYALFD